MWVSTFNLLTLGMKGKREQMEMLERQMRSGVGRIKVGGRKEGSVLACVLWNSLLWFVAEICEGATAFAWLRFVVDCTDTQTCFSSSLHLALLSLWASLFVFSSEVCHRRAKQRSAEEDAVRGGQNSELENSSVRARPGHALVQGLNPSDALV